MSETRFTEFLALSVDPRVVISRFSVRDRLKNRSFYNNIYVISLNILLLTLFDGIFRTNSEFSMTAFE